MATNFPTGVDTFTNPVSNDSLNSPSHSVQHADANDAIEAIEGYILNGTGAAWQSWAPTLGAGWLNGNGTWTAAYAKIGKTVHMFGAFTIGSTTTKGSNLQFTLPVTAAAGRSNLTFTARASVAGGTIALLRGRFPSATGGQLDAVNAAATYATLAQITATVPATWATSDSFTFFATYEAE
jgi:hypothetical protein